MYLNKLSAYKIIEGVAPVKNPKQNLNGSYHWHKNISMKKLYVVCSCLFS